MLDGQVYGEGARGTGGWERGVRQTGSWGSRVAKEGVGVKEGELDG